MTHFAVPTVNLLIIKDSKILLSRRANTGWMDGYLVIPGGHVEDNETPAEAMVREANEELGLDLRPEDLSFVCVAVRNQKPVEHLAFEFRIDGSSLDPQNMEPEKCRELVWASLDNIPDDVVADFKRIITEGFLGSKAYIEIGWPEQKEINSEL